MGDPEYVRAQQARKRQQLQGSLQFNDRMFNGRSSTSADFRPMLLPSGKPCSELDLRVHEEPASHLSHSKSNLAVPDSAVDLEAPAMVSVVNDLGDDGLNDHERRHRNQPRRRHSTSPSEDESLANKVERDPQERSHEDEIETVGADGAQGPKGRRGALAWQQDQLRADDDGGNVSDSGHDTQRRDGSAQPIESDEDDEAKGSQDTDDENSAGMKRRKKKKKRTGIKENDQKARKKKGGVLDDAYVDLDLNDLRTFALQPATKGVTMACRVTRDNKGIGKSTHPVYYLHLEHNEERRTFLLAARRRKKTKTSTYVITTDATDLSRHSAAFIGKTYSNFLGTQFTLSYAPSAGLDRSDKRDLALVMYETNVLGFKGPRKMSVVIPGMNDDGARVELDNGSGLLMDRVKHKQFDGLIDLHNKTPVWNEETHSYVLNFHGRVTQASVKNFQLVHSSDTNYIVLQFGRIAEDTFTVDYAYPLCALQAFGITLSSFDNKLACE